MPIEIRELVIAVKVDKEADKDADTGGRGDDSFDFVDAGDTDAAAGTHTRGVHVLMGDGSVHFLGEHGEVVDLVAADDGTPEPDREVELRIEDDDAAASHFDGRLLTARDLEAEQSY